MKLSVKKNLSRHLLLTDWPSYYTACYISPQPELPTFRPSDTWPRKFYLFTFPPLVDRGWLIWSCHILTLLAVMKHQTRQALDFLGPLSQSSGHLLCYTRPFNLTMGNAHLFSGLQRIYIFCFYSLIRHGAIIQMWYTADYMSVTQRLLCLLRKPFISFCVQWIYFLHSNLSSSGTQMPKRKNKDIPKFKITATESAYSSILTTCFLLSLTWTNEKKYPISKCLMKLS